MGGEDYESYVGKIPRGEAFAKAVTNVFSPTYSTWYLGRHIRMRHMFNNSQLPILCENAWSRKRKLKGGLMEFLNQTCALAKDDIILDYYTYRLDSFSFSHPSYDLQLSTRCTSWPEACSFLSIIRYAAEVNSTILPNIIWYNCLKI
jgi:hypothetical protein